MLHLNKYFYPEKSDQAFLILTDDANLAAANAMERVAEPCTKSRQNQGGRKVNKIFGYLVQSLHPVKALVFVHWLLDTLIKRRQCKHLSMKYFSKYVKKCFDILAEIFYNLYFNMILDIIRVLESIQGIRKRPIYRFEDTIV